MWGASIWTFGVWFTVVSPGFAVSSGHSGESFILPLRIFAYVFPFLFFLIFVWRLCVVTLNLRVICPAALYRLVPVDVTTILSLCYHHATIEWGRPMHVFVFKTSLRISTACPLKMGPIVGPETSVTRNKPTLHSIPVERRPRYSWFGFNGCKIVLRNVRVPVPVFCEGFVVWPLRDYLQISTWPGLNFGQERAVVSSTTHSDCTRGQPSPI
jgi:hypothetical protein